VSEVGPLSSFLWALGGTLVGAVFAAADTALASVTGHHLSALIEQAEGPRRGLFERIRRENIHLHTTYLVGRTMCLIVAVIGYVDGLGPLLPEAHPYLGGLAALLAIGLAFEIVTTVARRHADEAVVIAARFMRPVEYLLLPFTAPLCWIVGGLRGRNELAARDVKLAEAEMEVIVDEVERSGLFGHEPAEMIRNVLEFADRTAKDVMVPRARIEGIDVAMPIDDVIRFVTESGHSRYPVYRDQIDHVVGLLYAKDLFVSVGSERANGGDEPAVRDILRTPAKFVAESQPLSKLLREMRAQRQHLAVVVDEFGAVSGIITLEDVLEEIVGDIRDEHDEVDETTVGEEKDGEAPSGPGPKTSASQPPTEEERSLVRRVNA
jgi:putative hemolysin